MATIEPISSLIFFCMRLISVLNQCYHFPGFVYVAARLNQLTKTIEVDVRERVGPVLEGLVQSQPGQDIVMIAHGGTIRAALSHALDLDGHQALTFSIKNLSLTRIEKHGPDWRVMTVNEEPWLIESPTPP